MAEVTEAPSPAPSRAVFASGATLQQDGTIVQPIVVDADLPNAVRTYTFGQRLDARQAAAGASDAPNGEPTPPVEPQEGDPAADPDAPAPAEPAEPDEESEEGEEGAQEPTESNRGFRKRLLTENQRFRQQVRNQDATIAYLQQQVDALKHQAAVEPQAPVQPQGIPGLRPRPHQGNYDTYTAYEDDLLAWHDERRTAQQAAEAAAQAQREAQAAWSLKEDEGRSKYADYDQAINRLAVGNGIASLVATAFRGSEYGPDLLYHIATHPKDMQHLNTLDAWGAARWLVELETRLSQPRPAQPRHGTTAQAAPPAPRPMQPVGTGAAVPLVGFREGMGLNEYEQMRLKERQGRR